MNENQSERSAILNKNQGATGTGSDTWLTPDWIVSGVSQIFGGIDIDPCGHESENTGAVETMLWPDRDGLIQPWGYRSTVYCNPPFSMINQWVKKAARERDENEADIIMLAKFDARLTGKNETLSWHQLLMAESVACRILKGYVNFRDEVGETCESATFQTALYLISDTFTLYDRFVNENPLKGYNVWWR
jgi:phage N-6-adenine-methyltransferase